MDFYERVKTLVKDNTDLTLRTFIESLDMNYDSYNGLKRYGNLPRADEALKIASALNTSVEYLVTGRESDAYRLKYKALIASMKEVIERSLS